MTWLTSKFITCAVWEEWQRNPEQAYLKSISNIDNTATALSVYEVLSTHAPNEEYIGERPTDWTENDLVNHTYPLNLESIMQRTKLTMKVFYMQ